MIEDVVIGLQLSGFAKAIEKIQRLESAFQGLLKNVKFEQSMQGFNRQFTAMQKNLEPLKKSVREAMIEGFVKPSMTATQAAEKIITKQQDLAKVGKDIAQNFGGAERVFDTFGNEMKPFRMELLSVMFGAQMVSNAMRGLLQPALTSVGLFELFSTVLEVLFLPIALLLLDWLLPIAQALMDMDPTLQLIIGGFVLFLGILAGGLAIFASLALFMGGLQMLFPALSAAILPIVGIIVLVVAVIAALIYLWVKWDDISWKVKLAIAAIGIVLALLLAPIAPVVAAVIGIGVAIMGVMAIIKNWDAITGWLKGVWGKIAGFFSSLVTDPMKEKWQSMVDWIKSLWDGVKEIWGKVTGGVKTVWNKITGKGTRQMGGYIPHSGLYKMHAGENVTSSYENNFAPNVNVNASSNVDIELLKRQLNQEWATEFGRLSRA